MNATDQIAKAKELGKRAFLDKQLLIPALNDELIAMLQNREPGTAPEGEASTMDILKSYQRGWLESYWSQNTPNK